MKTYALEINTQVKDSLLTIVISLQLHSNQDARSIKFPSSRIQAIAIPEIMKYTILLISVYWPWGVRNLL